MAARSLFMHAPLTPTLPFLPPHGWDDHRWSCRSLSCLPISLRTHMNYSYFWLVGAWAFTDYIRSWQVDHATNPTIHCLSNTSCFLCCPHYSTRLNDPQSIQWGSYSNRINIKVGGFFYRLLLIFSLRMMGPRTMQLSYAFL